MPATRATSDVQTQAMPAMTLPATVVCGRGAGDEEHCRPYPGCERHDDRHGDQCRDRSPAEARALIVPGVADELRG